MDIKEQVSEITYEITHGIWKVEVEKRINGQAFIHVGDLASWRGDLGRIDTYEKYEIAPLVEILNKVMEIIGGDKCSEDCVACGIEEIIKDKSEELFDDTIGGCMGDEPCECCNSISDLFKNHLQISQLDDTTILLETGFWKIAKGDTIEVVCIKGDKALAIDDFLKVNWWTTDGRYLGDIKVGERFNDYRIIGRVS